VKDPLHVVFVIINFLYPFPPHFVGRIIFCSSILSFFNSFFNQKSLCNKLKSFSMLLVLFLKRHWSSHLIILLITCTSGFSPFVCRYLFDHYAFLLDVLYDYLCWEIGF